MDLFTLNEDERVITETAAAFAAKRIAPYALEWDVTKHFAVDMLRESAELGMAAIYCREDVGGSGLRRLDGVRIFEQLAIADPTTAAFLSIHNMCAWMIDTFGTAEQRKVWVPRLASMDVVASRRPRLRTPGRTHRIDQRPRALGLRRLPVTMKTEYRTCVRVCHGRPTGGRR